MAVINHSQEITVRVSHKRMFKAMVIEHHTHLPNIMPRAVKSIDLLHGGGGAGTIRQTNFHDGSAKHMIHALDTENYTTKYSLIEGAWLGDMLEKIHYEVKFEKSGNGGCVIKIMMEYHTKRNVVSVEEVIRAGKDQATRFYNAAEAYLHDNPNICA